MSSLVGWLAEVIVVVVVGRGSSSGHVHIGATDLLVGPVHALRRHGLVDAQQEGCGGGGRGGRRWRVVDSGQIQGGTTIDGPFNRSIANEVRTVGVDGVGEPHDGLEETVAEPRPVDPPCRFT